MHESASYQLDSVSSLFTAWTELLAGLGSRVLRQESWFQPFADRLSFFTPCAVLSNSISCDCNCPGLASVKHEPPRDKVGDFNAYMWCKMPPTETPLAIRGLCVQDIIVPGRTCHGLEE